MESQDQGITRDQKEEAKGNAFKLKTNAKPDQTQKKLKKNGQL